LCGLFVFPVLTFGAYKNEFSASMAEQESSDKALDQENREPRVDREQAPPEYGGPKGKDPTRYGDWEKNGRCIDF
jgi:hypothetical protein